MFDYVAHGINIHSDLQLPELASVEAEAAGDVIIRPGKVPEFQSDEVVEEGCFLATAEEAFIFWEDVGSFQVIRGREIVFDPIQGVEDGLLHHVILGSVLAILLHQRGLLVLHASSVADPDGAVVVLGDSGWGKSTVAAALCSRGFGFVTDDVLSIDNESGTLKAVPGIPRVKMAQDAAVMLGYDPGRLQPLYSGLDKKALPMNDVFVSEPIPIKCVYVIDEGDVLETKEMSTAEAMMETIRHSIIARVPEDSRAAAHFEQCAHLARSVTYRWLRMERDNSTLADLADMVADDIASFSL
jgi:hypothetical protein